MCYKCLRLDLAREELKAIQQEIDTLENKATSRTDEEDKKLLNLYQLLGVKRQYIEDLRFDFYEFDYDPPTEQEQDLITHANDKPLPFELPYEDGKYDHLIEDEE
ncbi:MAG: hypothetical protein E6R03_18150 [Hyphomicrobiaceae bacterium]|nr:MAG: hypothetical protein E6R03_18150 [Hyphomicrobiaceae bacterium]